MNGFTDEWLALREPADTDARSERLIERLRISRAMTDPLHVLDLGAGTGANLRFLAPRLGFDQQWLLVDHDSQLLGRLPYRLQAWAESIGGQLDQVDDQLVLKANGFSVSVSTLSIDLSTDLSSLPFANTNLVTGSALLDLVSDQWLQSLAQLCAAHQCAVLFALTYDGRVSWEPPLPRDSDVVTWLNRHQRQVKSFGLALGPDAIDVFRRCYKSLGFSIHEDSTPWIIDSTRAQLHATLLSGWAQAVAELDGADLSGWLEERQALIAEPENRLTVGHTDFLAVPPF